MAKLVLSMIVKNEAHIIEETLQNLVDHLPFDYWVISDTGSTDGTQKLIKDFFAKKKIKGKLYQDQWQDFAHNRNLALDHARDKGDYSFIFDADDLIEGDFQLPKNWDKDAYNVTFSNESRTVTYQRPCLIKNRPDIYWRGVLHEFLEFPTSASIGQLEGDYKILSRRKGSRNQDSAKYYKDAQVFERAIKAGQDQDLLPRYTFYCARSYRDADLPREALPWFEKRLAMTDGWSEEAYCSALDAAYIYEDLGNLTKAKEIWEKAITINPQRAEAWHQLSRVYRQIGQPHQAFAMAYMAKDLKPQSHYLFIWSRTYDCWIPLELMLNGLKIGRLAEAYQGFRSLVLGGHRDVYQDYLSHLADFAPYLDQEVVDKLKSEGILQ